MATNQTNLAPREKSEMRERTEPRRVTVAPPVDVYENADELLIVADVPGVADKDIDIHLERSELRITARRNSGEEAIEYRRSFVLPTGVDGNRVTAELKHGVLSLHLPKEEQIKPRQIKVQSS